MDNPTFAFAKSKDQNSEQLPEMGGRFFGQSSFANFSVVSQASVVNANDLVKNKEELQLFAPLGCGIQTGSGTVINVAKATPNDVLAIQGLGGVGLSAVMAAKIQGCRIVIGIDRVESRLQSAKDFGATHVVDTSKLPPGKTVTEVVQEIADGVGPNIFIETTGVPVLIKAAVEMTRQGGKIIQVGSAPADFSLELPVFNFMVSGKVSASLFCFATDWITDLWRRLTWVRLRATLRRASMCRKWCSGTERANSPLTSSSS